MADLFDQFLEKLLAREGGYSNRAADKGGETNYGITVGVARSNGYAGKMEDLPKSFAAQVYRTKYWTSPGFDQVAKVSPRIAEELLDTGVNMGPQWPGAWLQRSLNLCNRQGRDWADVPLSGAIGPLTMSALRSLLQVRGVRAGEDLMLKCLNGFQFERYVEITEAGGPNGSQEQNIVGWISQRIGFPGA